MEASLRSEMGRPRPRTVNITQQSFPRIAAELAVPTQEILRALPGIQEHELAWELAVFLLNSEAINSQFYGAHTLHHKICRNWGDLVKNEEKKQLIRQFILNRLFDSLSSQDNRSVVTIKLFSALILLAFQEYKNGWKSFIEDILSAIDLAFPSQTKLTELAKLQFLTLLSEEYENPRLSASDRKSLLPYVAEGRNVALGFVDRYTAISEGQASPDSDLLREKGLDCLRTWVQFGIPALELPQITDRLVQNFLWGGAHEICAEVLSEILNHRNTVQVQDTIFNKLFNWLTSSEMQTQVQRAISAEDSFLSRSLVKIYASFGENYYGRLISDLGKVPEGQSTPQLVYLDIMLALTNYPGNFPTDQNISENGLEFWHLFLEGVVEYTEGKEGPRDVEVTLQALITRLITVVHSKIMFPSTEDLQTWDHDEFNSFRIYRMDAGEILSGGLYILKLPYPTYYMELAMNTVLSLTSKQATGPDLWQGLEATLFLLRKLTLMNFSVELTPLIIQLFSSEVLGRVLDTNLTTALEAFQNKYLKIQALKICGDYAQHYKMDQKVLSGITQQIVCAFSVSELKSPATSAFRDICEKASLELTFSVEAMITTLTSLQNHLEPPELQRMLESVACLVTSAQGPDDLIPTRLQAMSQFIIEGQEALLLSLQSTPEDILVQCTVNNFQSLTSCCTGAGSKAEGVENVIYPIPASIPYTERVFLVISRTLELAGHIEPISVAIASFIDKGLGMQGYPSPFCFPLDSLLNLLGAAFRRHTMSAYLDSIRQVVQTYAVKAPSPDNPIHMATVNHLAEIASTSIDISLQNLTNPTRIDDQPDLAIALSDFLAKLINMAPHSFLMLPEAAHHAVINFGILGITSQDRQIIRSMSTFLNELFILEKREASYARALQLNAPIHALMVQSYGYQLLHQILECIGSTMPRSYLSLITEMFRKFLSVHHQEAATWLPSLLSQEGFPSTHIDSVAKRKFSSEFLRATNNSMHFKSLVSHFSQVCWALFPSSNIDIIFS